ncbi:Aminomethyltransferase folate-binding domain-containing protein [Massarina eburnea CBS 473.64]|uniref:Iron-sulfur cluster assembly factor IBA57 homolog, mitochondrial n=1 Tax=Massarina eburnea CBS 473.64 TaxID=1395130 RepID=A0A6A6RMF6_9PLEO|nr:Aminomethyltransferase folate-binding domain-containing protein [Massarina eburnea CBS 473.64]
MSGTASSGGVALPHRRLISLSGPDTTKFLHGLITNNVLGLEAPGGFYSAFLDARGRVLWDVFVYIRKGLDSQAPSAYIIEIDAGEVEALVKHLRRHKLRSKVTIEVVEDSEVGVWASQNGLGLGPVHIQDPRGQDMGARTLGPSDKSTRGDGPSVDIQQYHLRRYLRGIPEGPLEIPRESALPMEYNFDLNQGIDFKKGCYVGQELTIRTKHTGVVRKRVLPVQLSLPSSATDTDQKTPVHDPDFPASLIPPNGADIKQLNDDGTMKKGRPAGKFIAAVGNVGIALVRLEMMTSMRVSAEGGSWKPGLQFGVQLEGEDGQVVRVKAFAPQWFRERERELWDKGRKRVFGDGGREERKADRKMEGEEGAELSQ